MSDGNIWCNHCSGVVPFRNLDGGIGECMDCGSRFPIPATMDPFEREVAERITQQVAELEAAPMPEYKPENFQPCGLTEGHPSLDESVKEEEYRPSDIVEEVFANPFLVLGTLRSLQKQFAELRSDLDELTRAVSPQLLKLRPLRRGPAEPSSSVRPQGGKPIICGGSPWSGRSESGETVYRQSWKGARIPFPGGPYYEDEGMDHEHDPVPPSEQLHEACWKCGDPVPGTLGARDKECEAQRGSPDGALGDDHPYSS